MVSVLPPHVAHDGRPARAGGYRKRVIYLEPEVLGESAIGRSVDRPDVLAAGLRARGRRPARCARSAPTTRSTRRHDSHSSSSGSARRSGSMATPTADPAPPDAAEALRAFLDARLFDPVTLVEPRRRSARLRRMPPAPSVRRLASARTSTSPAGDSIRPGRGSSTGQPLADVAASVGFYDQAHLTRRFKRFLGVTPGRFGRDESDERR